MVSFKLKFRPSTVEGRMGSLYYQVINARKLRQITTPYKIFPKEWDAEKNEIRTTPPSARSSYLTSIKRNIRYDMDGIQNIIKQLNDANQPVTSEAVLEAFRKQAFRGTLFGYMEKLVVQYWEQGKYRTSETYSTTLNSFRRFRSDNDVNLEDVDTALMESYESFLKREGLSPNTISFYLKHLRAAYNRAIDEHQMTDRKPFRRVSTSIERTLKRAVSLRLIKQLKALDYTLQPSRQFARDMFLFSFYTRGMSFVDIAYLQKKNLKGEVLSYRRKKTNQQLTLYWETCMQEILKKYAADDTSPYLFSIIRQPDNNPRKQYQNAMFLVNKHLKKIGKNLGLAQPLTMYCARHSWASIARNSGIPLSVISEGMGHDSEKTTQIYLSSLKTQVIDKANRKILRLL